MYACIFACVIRCIGRIYSYAFIKITTAINICDEMIYKNLYTWPMLGKLVDLLLSQSEILNNKSIKT